MKPIKFNQKLFSQKLLKSVSEVIKSGWLTHGRYTAIF